MNAREKIEQGCSLHKGYAYCLAGLEQLIDTLDDFEFIPDGLYLIGYLKAGLGVSDKEFSEAKEELK